MGGLLSERKLGQLAIADVIIKLCFLKVPSKTGYSRVNKNMHLDNHVLVSVTILQKSETFIVTTFDITGVVVTSELYANETSNNINT